MLTESLIQCQHCLDCHQVRQTLPPSLQQIGSIDGLTDIHTCDGQTSLQWTMPLMRERKECVNSWETGLDLSDSCSYKLQPVIHISSVSWSDLFVP